MDSFASTCHFCGQEITKFTLRLLPARKMPKKSLKLYHNPVRQKNASSTFNPDQSSFKTYIHRLSLPKNVVKIKCGICATTASMATRKPAYHPPASATPSSSSTPIEGKRSRKRKHATPKDDNAGLIIPASLRFPANPSPASQTPLPTPPESKSAQSVLFSNQRINTKPISLQNPPSEIRQNDNEDQLRPSKRTLYNQAKKSIRNDKKKKKQEVALLQKALLKSKEMANSGSSSLGRFLEQD